MSAITRRELLVSAVGGIAVARTRNSPAFERRLIQLEEKSGGRLGVAVLDTATGVQAGYRRDERFPMCSTVKLLAVAAVLLRTDRGEEQLDRIVHFAKSDIVPYSPVTETRAGDRGISIKELCVAAMTLSDNTANNLVLATIGGPKGLTAFARTIGDDKTRLDRIEPELNQSLPGDPRDTTTPLAMLSDLRTLALGNVLSESSKAQLAEWLIANTTGDTRLRAGLPSGWKVGDKTGTGKRGTANDVAIAWPPGGAPILVSVYLTGARVDGNGQNRAVAAVGAEIPSLIES
ncbi:MAG TPA: class A beta-lactamase [Bryobacteraceae bacterium]|jgi:beta-lactamase class A|nr:class A beta-lactamase [Bryobacteraceae bacterium]